MMQLFTIIYEDYCDHLTEIGGLDAQGVVAHFVPKQFQDTQRPFVENIIEGLQELHAGDHFILDGVVIICKES